MVAWRWQTSPRWPPKFRLKLLDAFVFLSTDEIRILGWDILDLEQDGSSASVDISCAEE